MEFQLSYFKSWEMMLWKCCTQYASKFGKLSSGHRTRKGQFSFQSQRKVKSLSHVRLFGTPWTVAYQAPPSMGFSRQECWSGLPFPSPGESSQLRNRTPVCRMAGRGFTVWATREAQSQRKAMPKNAQSTAQLHSSHMLAKLILQILLVRLQQYMNCELSDVQAGFRKGRGTRDQIANIHWIIK